MFWVSHTHHQEYSLHTVASGWIFIKIELRCMEPRAKNLIDNCLVFQDACMLSVEIFKIFKDLH